MRLVILLALLGGCAAQGLPNEEPCCDPVYSGKDPGIVCGPYAEYHLILVHDVPTGALCTCPLTSDGKDALPTCK